MQATSTEVLNESATAAETHSEKVPLELLVDWDGSRAVSPAPRLAYGTVAAGDDLAVVLPDGKRSARRAKSCLVAAEPGDRVLCSTDGDAVYILAVLEGDGGTKVVADGKLEIVADQLKMRARTASLAFEELRIFGRSVEATFGDKASVFAERIESRASRFVQRAKQAFRFVEELEQLRAGNIDMRAESLAAIRGENTIVTARVLAKIDGEQVKIG